ncbi:hypothetical protein LRS65_26915 (plasmid) [Bacillus cereus]|uniref:hypothetical protein n=1 Tax=Bacillus cereus TaxID=1396 RepID=UPI00211C8C0F|nr:hypothetical protein [Bacillus cereus]UUN20244.1 hypothetical protein LRS65_26915 [Bacillus cereus]
MPRFPFPGGGDISCIISPSLCAIDIDPIETFKEAQKELSRSFDNMPQKFPNLSEDIKAGLVNIGNQVKSWTILSFQSYIKAYEFVEPALDIIPEGLFGGPGLVDVIIKSTVKNYYNSGLATGEEDCTVVVKAAIAFYAYNIKETKPDLAYFLMGSTLTDAIPAACRLFLN